MSDDATTMHHDERARASTEENQRHTARRSGRAIDCGASTKPQDDEVISWRQQDRAPYGRCWRRDAGSYGEQSQSI
jgi:hypothetical protein